MSANPHANGGPAAPRSRAARLPGLRRRGGEPRAESGEPTRVLGRLPPRRDRGTIPTTFRIVGPDETLSNRLSAVFEATDRVWQAEMVPGDEFLAPQGRVMEVLSEHLCEGWLEGYLLTGRHGSFNCYEAFIHIVDSMVNQHAKWLKTTRGDPLAAADRLAQLPPFQPCLAPGPQRILPSGSRIHRSSREQEARDRRVSTFLPMPTTLLSVADHCLRSRDYVNLIVAGKQPSLNYLTMDEAVRALHPRARDLRMGEQRRRRAARRRPGLRRRHPDPRDSCRRVDTPRAVPRTQGPGRQCRRPDAYVARHRASPRPAGRPVRRDCSRLTGP